MLTDVMFRVTKSKRDGLDVYALFPGIAGTAEPHTCSCYQHVGQHSSADLRGCIAASRPATRAEYRGLARELVQRGYKLWQVKRATIRHYRERFKQIAR